MLSLPSTPRAQARSRGAPHLRQSGAGSGRSKPWRRSPKPLAHSAKAQPVPTFPASAGPFPRSAQIRPAGRDRSAASLGSDHQNPQRAARKPLLSRASSASAGPFPRSAPYAQRSGICERRPDPAERPNPSATGLLQTLNNSPESTHQPLTPRVFIDLETRADSPLKKTKQQTDTHP